MLGVKGSETEIGIENTKSREMEDGMENLTEYNSW